jgi:hypothetical protein
VDNILSEKIGDRSEWEGEIDRLVYKLYVYLRRR